MQGLINLQNNNKELAASISAAVNLIVVQTKAIADLNAKIASLQSQIDSSVEDAAVDTEAQAIAAQTAALNAAVTAGE